MVPSTALEGRRMLATVGNSTLPVSVPQILEKSSKKRENMAMNRPPMLPIVSLSQLMLRRRVSWRREPIRATWTMYSGPLVDRTMAEYLVFLAVSVRRTSAMALS